MAAAAETRAGTVAGWLPVIVGALAEGGGAAISGAAALATTEEGGVSLAGAVPGPEDAGGEEAAAVAGSGDAVPPWAI